MALASQRLRRFDIKPEELDAKLQAALGGISAEDLDEALTSSIKDIQPGTIVIATVDSVDEHTKTVIMDIGGKSEGQIPLSEFGDTLPEKGQQFEVFYEGEDSYDNTASLSKRRADRLRAWERVSEKYNEGDEIQGIVQRKIKGGLLVDVEGVNVFLPASQVNLRRTHDISAFVEEPIRARIIKIDPERMNIVISRRKLLEEERQRLKENLLEEIEEKQIRMGVVKNIADFGVFVDLGGIDGLLHITDMSWGRISHPSKMVELDQEIEVMVLRVDRDRERIALGLKQKQASPWEGIDKRYPVNSKNEGEVVNIMSYGAFVKLEDGIEGLVHISEMSWTRRINHPSELVKSGDKVEVVVLDIDHDKQEISLGMKQLTPDPWLEEIPNKYHVGDLLSGYVTKTTSFGAFVKLEDDLEGLLHISELSDTKIDSPEDVLRPGMRVEVRVIRVDIDERKIGLSFVHAEFPANEKIVAQMEEERLNPSTEGSAESSEVSIDVPSAEPVARAEESPAEAPADEAAAPAEAPAPEAAAPEEAAEVKAPAEAETPAEPEAPAAAEDSEPKTEG